MDPAIQMFVSITLAILGSSGLWTFLNRRAEKKDVRTQLLIGIAHDRIMYLASKYIDRGWITSEEYDNLYRYLYVPYHENGGNGSGDKIMQKVDRLPMYSHGPDDDREE